MGLRFSCSHCGNAMIDQVRAPGESVVCDHCHSEIMIPEDPSLLEHVDDPATVSDSGSVAAAVQQRRLWAIGVQLFLWLLIIVSTMVGMNLLISAKEQEVSVPNLMTAVGVLLLVSVIFLVAILRKRRWGVWGYLAVYLGLLALCAIQMNWSILIKLLMGLGVFFLIIRSEWERLR